MSARFLRPLLSAVLLAATWAGGAAAQSQSEAEVPTADLPMRVEVLRVRPGGDGEPAEVYVPVTEAVPGDVVEYRIVTTNRGDDAIAAGRVVVSVPIGEGLVYLEGSAGPAAGDRVLIEFSADDGRTFAEPARLGARPEAYDAIRWTLVAPFEPGQEETFFYRVEVM